MINFHNEIPNSRTVPIKKIAEKASTKLGLNDISFSFEIKDNLKDDINVNYKKLSKKLVKIEIGKEALKNFGANEVYHEFFHVRDAIKNGLDFSDNMKGYNKQSKIMASIILNFSVDGRLDKLGLPHIPKSERIGFTTDFLLKRYPNLKGNFVRKELNKLWGVKLRKKKDVLILSRRFESKLKND